MNERSAADSRLLAILDDAMWATIWCAIALLIMVLLSYLGFNWLMRPWAENVITAMWGVPAHIAAIIWVAAIALGKLTAASFVAMALGLWVWKHRLLRRLGETARTP